MDFTLSDEAMNCVNDILAIHPNIKTPENAIRIALGEALFLRRKVAEGSDVLIRDRNKNQYVLKLHTE